MMTDGHLSVVILRRPSVARPLPDLFVTQRPGPAAPRARTCRCRGRPRHRRSGPGSPNGSRWTRSAEIELQADDPRLSRGVDLLLQVRHRFLELVEMCLGRPVLNLVRDHCGPPIRMTTIPFDRCRARSVRTPKPQTGHQLGDVREQLASEPRLLGASSRRQIQQHRVEGLDVDAFAVPARVEVSGLLLRRDEAAVEPPACTLRPSTTRWRRPVRRGAGGGEDSNRSVPPPHPSRLRALLPGVGRFQGRTVVTPTQQCRCGKPSASRRRSAWATHRRRSPKAREHRHSKRDGCGSGAPLIGRCGAAPDRRSAGRSTRGCADPRF